VLIFICDHLSKQIYLGVLTALMILLGWSNLLRPSPARRQSLTGTSESGPAMVMMIRPWREQTSGEHDITYNFLSIAGSISPRRIENDRNIIIVSTRRVHKQTHAQAGVHQHLPREGIPSQRSHCGGAHAPCLSRGLGLRASLGRTFSGRAGPGPARPALWPAAAGRPGDNS
jgi:hypothetical protein